MPHENQDTPAKKRIPRWAVAVAAIVVLGSLGLLCAGGVVIALSFSALGSNTTDNDFATDTDRITYLNSVIPIAIPASASAVRFEKQGFQDQHVDATFTLPSNDIDRFIQSLPPLDQPTPDVFDGKIGFTYIRIEVDRATGNIHIKWFET